MHAFIQKTMKKIKFLFIDLWCDVIDTFNKKESNKLQKQIVFDLTKSKMKNKSTVAYTRILIKCNIEIHYDQYKAIKIPFSNI